jgi:hypothetical protein
METETAASGERIVLGGARAQGTHRITAAVQAGAAEAASFNYRGAQTRARGK